MSKIFILLSLLINIAGLTIFSGAQGTSDVPLREKWAKNLQEVGFIKGYEISETDYPPLGIGLIAIINITADRLHLDHYFGLQLILALTNFALAIFLYHLTANFLLALFFELAFIPISLGLGYIDLLYLYPLILSLHALGKNNLANFSIFYLLSVMIKWQALIIAPVLVLSIFRKRKILAKNTYLSSNKILFVLTIILLITCLCIFKFELLQSFIRALTHKAYSANAANFYWLLSSYLNSNNFGLTSSILVTSFRVEMLAKLFFLTTTIVITIWLYLKLGKSIYLSLSSLIVSYFYFLFNLGVHENHLLTAATISLLATTHNPALIKVAYFLLFSSFLNPILFYGLDGQGNTWRIIFDIDLTLILAILNLTMFIYILNNLIYEKKDKE